MTILKEKLPTCMRRYDYHLLALDRALQRVPEQHESFIKDYNAINLSAAEDDNDDDAEPVEDDDEALLENDDTEELFAEQEAMARTVQPLPHAMEVQVMSSSEVVGLQAEAVQPVEDDVMMMQEGARMKVVFLFVL